MKCLHVSDSGRTLPGMGSYKWQEIFNCLAGMGFDGPLSHEPVMLYFDEKKMGTDTHYTAEMEAQFASGIKFLKTFMN